MATQEYLIENVVAKGEEVSIQSLRKELQSYRTAALNAEKGTEEYSTAIEKAAEIQRRLNEVQRDLRTSTLTLAQTFAQGTNAVRGLSAGFQAFQSLQTLIGGENEELTKTFVRLQAAMSLTQSLSQLTTGIKSASTAFRGLRNVLAGHPIFIFLTVISGITAGLYYLGNALADNDEKIKNLRESHQDFIDTLKIENEEQAFAIRLLRARGIDEEEILLIQRQQTKQRLNQIGTRIEALRLEYKQITENLKWYQKISPEVRKYLKELESNWGELEEEYQKLSDKIFSLDEDIEVARARNATNRLNAERQSAQQREREREQELQREAKLEQEYNDIFTNIRINAAKRQNDLLRKNTAPQELIDIVQSEIDINNALQEILLETANNEELSWERRNEAAKQYQTTVNEGIRLAQEAEAINQQIDAAEKERRENQLSFEELYQSVVNPENLTHEEQLEREKERLNTELENLLLIANTESETYDVRLKALEDYMVAQDKLAKLEKESADAKVKEEKRKQDAITNTLNTTRQALDGITSLLGESTLAGKLAAIASTTVQTYQAAQAAYTSQLIPGDPTSLPRAIAAGAAAAISGIANVKKIIETKVPNASGSQGSTQSTVPTLPVFPDFETPVQEVHNNMDGYDEEFFNQNIRVYVTESDITNAQNRVRVSENDASFP